MMMEENEMNAAEESARNEGEKVPEEEPALSSPRRAGGFLLLLAIILLLSSLRTIFIEILIPDVDESMQMVMQRFPAMGVSLWVHKAALFGLSIWSLVAAYKLLKVTPDAVKVTKAYLLVFAIYPFVFPFISMGLMGIPARMYGSALGFYFTEVFSPGELVGVLIFALVWYAYLCRSKRVRETFFHHVQE